jgi:Fe-Mn family superoxide dismutase
MSFELPPLPYSIDALEPHISRRTMDVHYGSHHRGYVTKLNELIRDTRYETMNLEDVVRESWNNRREHQAIFNNAGQAWNHTFFWHSMTGDGGGAPQGELAVRLGHAFGGYDSFRQKFLQAATGQFGSGWIWLVLDGERLTIVSTGNAQTPLADGKTPLLTCDVWEHAYYLDYQNQRKAFVEHFLDHLIDWGHVEQRLRKASQYAATR